MFVRFLVFFILAAYPCLAAQKPELVIYTYDSLVAPGGLGPELFQLFEKRCECKVRPLSSGTAGQILSRLQLDARQGKTPKAHVVLGFDEVLSERARPWLEPLEHWRPKGYSRILPGLWKSAAPLMVPYDYGVFAFIADTEKLARLKAPVPKSVLELRDSPLWRRNVILEDPRTSAPGLAFLLYTEQVFGKEVWGFWKNFRRQWLTLAASWDGAYGLFLKGEAPLVWSYTTSQAYHAERGDRPGRYRALFFDEGNPIQIEGAALVRGAFQDEMDRKRALDFLEFLLTPEVQQMIPRKNWMFPVISGTVLPPSFQKIARPVKFIRLPKDDRKLAQVLAQWGKTVETGR